MGKDLSIKDHFYQLLQNPNREDFVKFLLNNIGEQDNIDFKTEWILNENLALLILAIANSGGGAIVLGVNEVEDGKFIPLGLIEFMDKAKIHNSIKKYLPKDLEYKIFDFDYSGEEYSKLKDKKFQVLIIEDQPRSLPFLPMAEGEKIKQGIVFIRHGTANEKVTNEDLQKILSRRIDTMYSSTSQLKLQEHLSQLKTLYEYIDENIIDRVEGGINVSWSKMLEVIEGRKILGRNPQFPVENYDQFINRMIIQKKLKIEKVLDLK